MCRSFVLWLAVGIVIAAVSLVIGEESGSLNFETTRNSNAAILNRLGLVPLRIPSGHYKKRLAGPEPSDGFLPTDSHTRIHQPYSRRHGHRDSHVYIVKLPPSQPYYTLTKPHKPPSGVQELDKITKTVSGPQVGFHSNGKPGKIYHWNLPVVKKITEKKRLHAKFRIEQMRKKIQMEMNDHDNQHQRQNVESVVNPNAYLHDNEKLMSVVSSTKPIVSDINGKRYHHATSGNVLHRDEKPIKHVRNNDKRLNYPKISEQFRESSKPNDGTKHNRNFNATSNKTYRLEDSNLYRLGVGDLRSNDRLAGWKIPDAVHASWNTHHGQKPKKHRKKAAMTYYAPINSDKMVDTTNAMTKNFPGNGKPKAFYVMEKSRQPVYYHPLLP